MIINGMAGGGAVSGLPEFTYTGTYTLLDDGDGNWRIKFLSSGTLTFEKTVSLDVCCVGGGGGSTFSPSYATGGGGSGYTATFRGVVCIAGTAYSVVVGAGGAASILGTVYGGKSWFQNETQYFANGGQCANYYDGGSGGSGGGGAGSGVGGTNGADGTNGSNLGGHGQGSTTREFGETSGALYAAGGSGNTGTDSLPYFAPNTGTGAKGRAKSAGTSSAGCSGIVVIRNLRTA